MKKLLLTALMSALGISALFAKVTLPPVLSDNMVLQRGTQVALWGEAGANKTVTVRPSWTKDVFSVKAGKDGRWMLRVPTPAEGGGPYEVRFSDGEELVLKNVLLGEVWFCSGQSNMEMTQLGYTSQPTRDCIDTVLDARADIPVRFCNVARCFSPKEEPVAECRWELPSPEVVSRSSAAAYFFARKLQSVLNVPVGVIVSAWGGSAIEAWISKEIMERDFASEFNFDHLYGAPITERGQCRWPCLLYNGQVKALAPFTFKGMLWYQGEANRGREEQYIRLQTAYAGMMRELFQNPDAPFYFVQIAPYIYEGEDNWKSGYFCEAQAATLKTIPHSGMVTTADSGAIRCIHPSRKQDVGKRFAYLALMNDYGMDFIDANPPVYESVSFSDGKARVRFVVDSHGLAPLGENLSGFEIAGADQVFHPADAWIDKRDGAVVEVSSPDVPQPAAVRYCFRNWCVGGLFNSWGIPAGVFRTDDWALPY